MPDKGWRFTGLVIMMSLVFVQLVQCHERRAPLVFLPTDEVQRLESRFFKKYQHDPVLQSLGTDLFVGSVLKAGKLCFYEIVPNNLGSFLEMPASNRPAQSVLLLDDGSGRLSRINLCPLSPKSINQTVDGEDTAILTFNKVVRLLAFKDTSNIRHDLAVLFVSLACHNWWGEYPQRFYFADSSMDASTLTDSEIKEMLARMPKVMDGDTAFHVVVKEQNRILLFSFAFLKSDQIAKVTIMGPPIPRLDVKQ